MDDNTPGPAAPGPGTTGRVAPHSRAARLLAVEVLLAEPEALADDVLESALYMLRDRLQGIGSEGEPECQRPVVVFD